MIPENAEVSWGGSYTLDQLGIKTVLKDGAYRASKLAYKTLDKVYRKVGFIPRVR